MLTSQGGASMATLHCRLNTQPDKISQSFANVLAERFYVTHIYIPFILSLFNYIHRCFELIWFLYYKFEKKQWTLCQPCEFIPLYKKWPSSSLEALPPIHERRHKMGTLPGMAHWLRTKAKRYNILIADCVYSVIFIHNPILSLHSN